MRKREIFIELTSLLDVILIMIFILLTQAKAQTIEAASEAASEREAAMELQEEVRVLQEEERALRASAEEAEAAFEKEKAALNETIDALGRQIITDGLVKENSLVLTLSTGQDASVRLETDDGETHTVPYEWGNDNYLRNRLNSLLTEQLENAGERSVFIVFQYDRTRIYKTEYELITAAVQEIKLEAGIRKIPLNFIEMDISE